MSGIDITRIPYKGQGQAVNAVLGGEVQLTFPSAGPVIAQVKAGKIRALGITSAEPSALVSGDAHSGVRGRAWLRIGADVRSICAGENAQAGR